MRARRFTTAFGAPLGLRSALASALGLALVAACTATENPERSELKPAERVASPDPTSAPSPAKASQPSPTPDAAPAPTDAAASATPAETAKAAPNAPTAQTAAPASTPASTPAMLGRVGGVPLLTSDFLRRLWIHDGGSAREVVEQMVFSRLVMFEADRLGVQVGGKAVDSAVAKAVAAIEKRLADKGSTLSFDEHVRRNIEVDPKLYRETMRQDAIVSLLAERCVRAWELECGLCRVRISEFRDKEKLATAQAELAAGKSFEAVAAEHGLGEDEKAGYTNVPIVRTESQELARVAFGAAVGSVAGPVEQSGAWLLFKIDTREEGRDVRWPGDGPGIEASLEREPLQNVEYVQWRTAMTRRYQLDLAPFLDLVTGGKP
jgi:hypothetical protein